MTATIKWREEFKASETINEEFPLEVFEGVGYVFGKDKEGRPITFAASSLLHSSFAVLMSIMSRYNVFGAKGDPQSVFVDLNRFLRSRISCAPECASIDAAVTIDGVLV